MELSDFYPCPRDLIDCELSVLGYLRDNRYIKERQARVATDAARYLSANKAKGSGFAFNSYFDVWHAQMPGRRQRARRGGAPSPNVRLFVSAWVGAQGTKFTNVTYSLSVCKMRPARPVPRLRVLRKFHFDVAAVAVGGRRQRHPSCHLQYCGKMVPYMAEVGCRDEQLNEMHPWLSEPRIFFWPMSLALLVDMALHEFPDPAAARITEDNYWRGLVRWQERLLLLPFYEKCVGIIRDAGERNQTLAEAFYIG